MSADETMRDAPEVLGLGHPPSLFVTLAEADAALLTRAWRGTRKWVDSRFFEEAAVLAALAVEEAADAAPPAGDPLRVAGIGGADLPELDRMVELVLQRSVKAHLVTLAWHRAITEPGFGDPGRFEARPVVPGRPRFMCDVPRVPAGGPSVAARVADLIGVPALADEFMALTSWPGFLRAAMDELAPRLSSDEWQAAVGQVRDRVCEMVAGLATPLPDVEGTKSEAAALVAERAESGPLLLVVAAFFRLLVPQVARIPHVA